MARKNNGVSEPLVINMKIYGAKSRLDQMRRSHTSSMLIERDQITHRIELS